MIAVPVVSDHFRHQEAQTPRWVLTHFFLMMDSAMSTLIILLSPFYQIKVKTWN